MSKQDLIEQIKNLVPEQNLDLTLLENKTTQELEATLADAQQHALETAKDDHARAVGEKNANQIIFQLKQNHLNQQRYDQEAPQRAEQLKRSRVLFSLAAKKLEKFGDNTANFNLVVGILGPGFSEFQLQQLDWVAVGLSAASPQELTNWRNEKVEERQHWLKHLASGSELREVARQEVANLRQQAKLSQFEQTLVQGYEREVIQQGLAKLPKHFQGQLLDANFIRTRSADQLRQLVRRFGSAQISARLHNINQIQTANGVVVFDEE